ncbi:hypothetical protein FRC01_002599, partial [Tulasnella sp. 417]
GQGYQVPEMERSTVTDPDPDLGFDNDLIEHLIAACKDPSSIRGVRRVLSTGRAPPEELIKEFDDSNIPSSHMGARIWRGHDEAVIVLWRSSPSQGYILILVPFGSPSRPVFHKLEFIFR